MQDILLGIKQWFIFFLKKWPWILLTGLLGGLLGYVYAYMQPPKYEARTTFVLSSENKSAGLAGLASQFGVDMGGGGSDAFSGENIIMLFKSELLLQRSLFKPIQGGSESLINYYCKAALLPGKWQTEEHTRSAFPFPVDPSRLTPVQDSLAREIYATISDHILDVMKTDKKTSFYEVKTTSISEQFSINLTNHLVDETTRFYIETKTKVARQNLSMLEREADSLSRLLGRTLSSTAVAMDRTFNANQAYQVNRAPIQQGQAKGTVLATAYGEVVKNLEIARFSLLKETPVFQIIDEARYPLKKIKLSKFKAALIGASMSCFFILIFLYIHRLMRISKTKIIQ